MKYRSRFYVAASWILASACGGSSFELAPGTGIAIDSPDGGDLFPTPSAAQDAGGAVDGHDSGPSAPAPTSTATKAPDRSLGSPHDGAALVDAAPAADAADAAIAVDAQADAPAVDALPPPPPPDAAPPLALCCTTGNPVYLVTSCAAGYQCFASAASSTCSVQALPDGGQMQTCTSTAPPLGACAPSGPTGSCSDGDYCIASDHSTAGYVHACP